MKTSVFKQLIKEAVREVFQEEMKSLLLEAVRAPKTVVNESLRDTYAQPHIENPKVLTSEERRSLFGNMISEMSNGFSSTHKKTTQDLNTFSPRSIDPVNGSLPEGNVGLDQIMNLMNK
jgi:hypothetical protein